MGSKPKKSRPSPQQVELEQLQLQELRRSRKEIDDLKAFTQSRRAGRRSLVFTGGAGTESKSRIGLDSSQAKSDRARLLERISGDELVGQLDQRGAISTPAPRFQNNFSPGGKGQRRRIPTNPNIRTLNLGAL